MLSNKQIVERRYLNTIAGCNRLRARLDGAGPQTADSRAQNLEQRDRGKDLGNRKISTHQMVNEECDEGDDGGRGIHQALIDGAQELGAEQDMKGLEL